MTGRLSRAEIDQALRSGPRITPSRHDPWTGRRQPGARFTDSQLLKITDEGRNPRTIEAVDIPLMEEDRRVVVATATCPVLARSRNGRRMLIVAPAGDKMWINAR
ncbi:hypothetical protein GO308_12705 [Sphingomonas sp. SFZ2018-12]|uniref:hypothetical protein n=1 Tax=Sphingomonas sp. SFZ2018-12 TaxID=2683197 RepID=UPI001F0DE76C|nr:hypothetical protein [Sphingomonas sp. SFZ2018-12]MCH4893975.1 hypothetical protein [Sphingomonas sp. SFZ2018-12]